MDRTRGGKSIVYGGAGAWRRARGGLDDAAVPADRLPVADLLARGVCRRLADLGYGTLTEFRVGKGRRVDVIGLSRDSRFVIVEIKTSEPDFRADAKWREYLPWCDTYFFAVPEHFPRDVLPPEHGLMIADPYDAAILRPSADLPMNPTRRRTQILRFGLAASARLRASADPWPTSPRSRIGR